MSKPLLEANDLRVDVHGAAAVDGLTLLTQRERVIVIGAPRALFDAACGMARPSRGTIAVQGIPSTEALASALIAGAPLDPPLPAHWSPQAYATWSARLAGFARGEAAARATAALERLGLRSLAPAPLGQATLAVKRATVIAAAFATGARVIALEDPSPSLEDDVASDLARLIARALEGRAWLLFAARAVLSSPLVAAAEEALVLAGPTVADRGIPRELATRARRYSVDVQGPGEALAARIASRGATVESLVVGPGSARFTLELPEKIPTRELFACAEQTGAVVVELRPISRAFA